MSGVNTSIVSFGVTDTRLGYDVFSVDGLATRAVQEIYQTALKQDGDSFLMECSMLELHNEKIYDLLSEREDFEGM